MVTCRQLIEFIGAYVDGEMDDAEEVRFERHLANCSSCRAYLESYRRTMKYTRALADDTPVDDVPEELVRWILARSAS